MKELNKGLLFSFDKISIWDFPDENLCPPIPGRLDYIHHLADLLSSEEPIKILDIGTGATCIYPLLGVASFDWKFVATDIDLDSLDTYGILVQVVRVLVRSNKICLNNLIS